MISAIIIDDVQNAREGLKQDILDYCPDLEVIGEADSVVAAAKLLKESSPELVFLDIDLGDGSGFDLLEILGEIPFRIIFTTSSDAHAVQAFRFSAVDYLLKPIDPEELRNRHGDPRLAEVQARLEGHLERLGALYGDR
jgi:two-component system LytT family response regulator